MALRRGRKRPLICTIVYVLYMPWLNVNYKALQNLDLLADTMSALNMVA